jgi:hypothetical protein
VHAFRILKLICLLALVCSTASYGATLHTSNGSLLGASGVNVNGALYDVSFQDGVCADLYDGCDQNSDFPFANPLDADDVTMGLAANIALLEQVFIDSPLGAFDSVPSLTNGCFAVGGCQVSTPLFLSQGGNGLGILWLFNRNNVDGDIGTGSGAGLRSFDTRIQNPVNDSHVYAVWHLAAPVPEAPPYAMLLAGMALVGVTTLRRRQPSAGAGH